MGVSGTSNPRWPPSGGVLPAPNNDRKGLGPHPAHLGLLGQGLGRKETWSQVMPRLRTNLMNFPLKFVQLFHRSCEQER